MIDSFVMPGQDVTGIIRSSLKDEAEKYIVGPGLVRDEKKTKAMKSGRLRMRDKPSVFWIESRQRRYVPVNGERVVGTVVSKSGFVCRVDIGANDLATLSLLSFEGATKRNRPDVSVGDVVFARIIAPARDVEAELVCITSALKRDGMGILATPASHFAQVVQVPVHACRKLLSPECKLLPLLGKKYRFEVAVGMNGRIWISAKTPENVIHISNLITRSGEAGGEEMTQLCDDLLGDVDFAITSQQQGKRKRC